MFLSRVIYATAKFPAVTALRPLATAAAVVSPTAISILVVYVLTFFFVQKPVKATKEPKVTKVNEAKVKAPKEPKVIKARKEKPPKKDPSQLGKADLVDHLSMTVQIPRVKVDELLTEFTKFVAEQTRDNGKTVRLQGFGVFKPKAKSAGTARNPKTQEAVSFPASKSFSFATSKTARVK